jgi:hypothetical protein
MPYWVYKCNSRGSSSRWYEGNWDQFFDKRGENEWGSTKIIRELEKARPGDVVFAYQTNRNELVGIAKVVRFRKRGHYKELILRPVEELHVKIRPLKLHNQAIARIGAFKSGPIHTLYSLTRGEAASLLRAANAQTLIEPEDAVSGPISKLVGGGFGSAEENRKVEKAAMKYIRSCFQSEGWEVRDVSSERRHGYDFECRNGRDILHVEAKGSKGSERKFILTQNEEHTWKHDKRFCLALVTNALNKPKINRYYGPNSMKSFERKLIASIYTDKNP